MNRFGKSFLLRRTLFSPLGACAQVAHADQGTTPASVEHVQEVMKRIANRLPAAVLAAIVWVVLALPAYAQYPKSYLLFYDDSTGYGATAGLNLDGTMVNLKFIPGFAYWDHITGLRGGQIVFYDSTTGNAATGRIGEDGTLVTEQSYGFSPWTHIVPAGTSQWDGSQFLSQVLFYNHDTGMADTGYVGGKDGKFHNQIFYAELRDPSTGQVLPHYTNMTALCPGSLGGGSFLFYDQYSQSAATGIADGDGYLHIQRTISGFSEWTDVVGVCVSYPYMGSTWEASLVFFYNKNLGTGATALVLGDGSLTTMHTYTSFDIGAGPRVINLWTHVAGLDNGLLLLYNKDSRTGMTASIDQFGNFRSLKYYTGFLNWSRIAAISID